MNPKASEIWLADLGLAAKLRPVVIVSRDDPDPPRLLFIYVPLTTQNRGSRYEVDLGKLPFLDEPSIANAQGIASAPRSRFESRLGVLPGPAFLSIKQALRFTLNLWLQFSSHWRAFELGRRSTPGTGITVSWDIFWNCPEGDVWMIDEGTEIGKDTKVWHFCHIMEGAIIGERCVLGQNVNVDGGTKIGNNVKIQNNVSVWADDLTVALYEQTRGFPRPVVL
jgi:mRNA interferase MazF